jgi:hypothetical protein
MLGNGDGTFQPPIPFPPGAGGSIVADINGDGILDLIGSGPTGLALAVFFGNGDGSFQPAVPISVTLAPDSLFTFADFNTDGKPDLAVVGPDPLNTRTQPLSIYPGNGDGTFGAATFSTTLPDDHAAQLATGDLNGDGKLDLVVCEPGGTGTGPIFALLGNGDGAFQTKFGAPSAATCGFSFALADVNGDSKLDVLSWSFNPPDPGGVGIFLGNGDGTFQANPTSSNRGGLGALADLNGDGVLDLVASAPEPGDTMVGPGIGILLGNGDGTFQPGVFTGANAGIELWAAGSGDFNGDGKMDLLAVDIQGNLWVLLQGLFPADTASPTALSFGAQTVDLPSAPQVVTLTNTGTAPLTLSGISVTGTNAAMFKETNTCGSSLAAGTHCQVQVVFTPTTAGARSAVLKVADNGVGGLLAPIPLSGNGSTVPTAVLSSTSISFTAQPIGKKSSSQTVTMTNGGSQTLAITSISVTGGNAADFSETDTCSSTVAIGATCQISVTFTPATGAPTETAAVTIVDNAVDSPQTISLSGTVALAGAGSFSPTSLTFPGQFVGTTGLPQTVTLTNTGSATLNIASITITPADFGKLSSCGSSLGVGQSCPIGVFFDPTSGGTRIGTLSVIDDGINSPKTLSLTGTGEDFSMGAGGAASATVTAGQTANYALGFSIAGGFNGTLTLSCSGAPAASTCMVSPSSQPLSGTSAAGTATVTVTTTARSAGFVLPFGTAGPARRNYRPMPLLASLLATIMIMIGSLLLWRQEQQRRRWTSVCAFALLLCAGMTLTSCGGSYGGNGGGSGGGTTGTQAGSYTITVSGSVTSGSTTLTHNTKLTLVVQ